MVGGGKDYCGRTRDLDPRNVWLRPFGGDQVTTNHRDLASDRGPYKKKSPLRETAGN
jgi:hypothetical protein